MTTSEVYLKDGPTGQLVKAELHDDILQHHLDQVEQHWGPLRSTGQQHGHWDWRKKHTHYSTQLSYESFAIECNGELQGLMIANTMKRCRLPQAANKHLVYIEYLEAAPWNRTTTSGALRFKGVGTIMVAAAIQLSMDEGNQGRIGLHSLPQADSFYRGKCGMDDLGPDASYHPKHPLRYFEMDEARAASFVSKGGGP